MRFGPEPALAIHARALGCKRETPLTGLCVGCPFQDNCVVPRTPLMLWTAHVNLEQGRAKPYFYLNSLSMSKLGDQKRILLEAGTASYRTTSVQIRSGDILTSETLSRDNFIVGPTLNLFEYLAPDRFQAENMPMVIMDEVQVRHIQLSNFGRGATLAIQTLNSDQALALSVLINENWHKVMRLLRKIRPLKVVRKIPASPDEESVAVAE